MLEREVWVDYAKAIGIILVVYGHVARGVFQAGMQYDPTIHYLVDSVIYSFHMPLFFFLSGLFYIDALKKRGVGVIVNKAETILYPFIIWSLLQGGIEVILSNYTNNHTTIPQVLSLFWAPRAQFWFLYALFLISIVGFFVYLRLSSKLYFSVFILSVLVYLIRDNFISIRVLNYVLMNFVFFSFGVLVYDKKSIWEKYNNVVLTTSAIVFLIFQWLFHIKMHLALTTEKYWLVLLLALISIIFVTSLCFYLRKFKIKWLALIGASSLGIYLMHVLVASGVRILLQKILGVENPFIHLALGSVVGILIPLIIMKYMQCKLQMLFTYPKVFKMSFLKK